MMAKSPRGGRRPGLVGCLLALLLATGCNRGRSSSPSEPSPVPTPSQDVFYAALGASDTLGIGASVPCFPFAPCPDGTGYVPIIVRRLAVDRQVTLTNLGIPAAVIGPHFQTLGRRYGRDVPGNLREREVPFVPRNANVVTVLAGPNDVNVVASALEGGAGGADPLGFVADQIRAFGADYDAVIRGIRDRAGAPRIVVANLPNFAGIPVGVTYERTERQAVQEISVRFSTEVINRLITQGVIVIDLLCDPRSYQQANYSPDGFHLNDSGYSFLADEMVDAISGAGYPPPSDSCPQMTLVPRP